MSDYWFDRLKEEGESEFAESLRSALPSKMRALIAERLHAICIEKQMLCLEGTTIKIPEIRQFRRYNKLGRIEEILQGFAEV